MVAPNAIVIGAGKAGSTSLHTYMQSHPAIFGSSPKELMYFSSRYNNGETWYLSHFEMAGQKQIRFETTPQYSFRDEFPETASRIRNFDPKMKIVYIVREPVDRIVSHFNHWARIYPNRYFDLEASLEQPDHRKFFVERTRYFYQIEAYRAVFPDEQIHVVFLEDLERRFEDTLNELFAFLGVARIASNVQNQIHNKRPDHTARAWSRNDIPAARMAELRTYLRPDVQALFTYCGKDTDFWGNAYI